MTFPVLARRQFLGSVSVAAVGAASVAGDEQHPLIAEDGFTAGSGPGPVFAGSSVVTGPSHDAMVILQPVQRAAVGRLEIAIGAGEFQSIYAESAGLIQLEPHVLKFTLPALPVGEVIRYKVHAHTVGWVKVREFYHGEVRTSEEQTTDERSFRTLDPAADRTSFTVWNDTHENGETLRALHETTTRLGPDFLVWNGDQSNDVHFERDMAGQFMNPAGLSLSAWKLAYVCGNHDVRGPEARQVAKFTGTPRDRFYYAFRSGPLACLVMDTGEDKPDDHVQYGGMAAFQPMQRRQLEWLKQTSREPWFAAAPHKVLFCHIPLYSSTDTFADKGRWNSHNYCRDLWSKALVEAGVKLIVSGHTHSHDWLPVTLDQPIAQLIGGGPTPGSATLVHGEATHESLSLQMSKLDGTLLQQIDL